MKNPFKNDIFSMIWQAFTNLYPDEKCECFWEPQIREDENGNKVFGLTDFGEDGSVMVFVRPDIKVVDAAEVFAHELAHVAVGVEHEHDKEWETAFNNIFEEYNKIGDKMFAKSSEVV